MRLCEPYATRSRFVQQGRHIVVYNGTTMLKAVTALLLAISIVVPASARNLYVPVAGVAPGANNTLFRTDVRLFNPHSTEAIAVTLHFLPQGLDGSLIPGRMVRIQPREMIVLNNVVTDFLGWPAPAIGAVRIDSNTAADFAVIASSRTYTDSPNSAVSGTYGQFIPALDPENAAQKTIVLHVTHNDAFRTNAGIMNPGTTAVTVTPSFVRADGTLVAEGAEITVPAKSMLQLSVPAMFGTTPPVEDGFIHFNASQPVFTFASVVDNGSGDQYFVVGAEDSAEVKPLP